MLEVRRLQMINDVLPSIGQGVGEITGNDDFSEFALFGAFYRVNYAFKDRYLFEASGRYDGSSKFPKNHRFGFFPSFSAGWRVSEEEFMDFSRNVLSNLKLRASWGSIGNQNIKPFEYVPGMLTYFPTTTFSQGIDQVAWFRNERSVITLGNLPLVRSNFTWEEVRTINFGVDLGFLHQKFNATFDIFKRETRGMLIKGMDAPQILGAEAPMQNAANMETKGWELQISWRDKIGDVTYGLGFNLSDHHSTITKYDNEAKIIPDPSKNEHYVGEKLGEIWGYVSDRLYTVDDFEDGTLTTTAAGELTGGTLKSGLSKTRSYPNPNVGDVMFKHADENGEVWAGASNTVDDPGSRRIIGNKMPRYIFGFNADVSWKGFGLSVLLQGTGKRQEWFRNPVMIPYSHQNMVSILEHHVDHWTPDNPNAHFARLYENAQYNTNANVMVQSRFLQNAAYLDIKSVVLSYDLPKSLISKINLDKVTVFISGENVWSFKHYPKGVHPHINIRDNVASPGYEGGASYPIMRMFTGGLNISF
jgi:TonB-linked SusC/RagA family outer membrane protein